MSVWTRVVIAAFVMGFLLQHIGFFMASRVSLYKWSDYVAGTGLMIVYATVVALAVLFVGGWL